MSTAGLIQHTDFKKEQTPVPDSTTSVEMSEFSVGNEVLVKQKDDRYYFGTVVQVNNIREQCLVKFGDNTFNWSSFKDLTKLSTPEQEDLLCVVCKKSAPKNKLEITVCDQCGRGYHQKCHVPEIPISCQKDGAIWMCKRCIESDPLRLKKIDSKHQRRDSLRSVSSSSNQENQSIPTSTIKVLPYDLNSLNWDTYHRVNSEQIYCYCGGNGEWYKQMLQCGRCRQWFHEKCLDFLQYPLYCGDRFYVFVCSICNHGQDFIRRLEMKWVDLVHLMLFNLTAYNSKKYYDLDSVVVPYINDNWHALQLPPKIANVSKSERRENIMSVLTNNRNRFKCGREIKKRTTIWGLRVRLPPPAPCVTLPPTGLVTEDDLRELWQGNRRLQFLPAEKNIVSKRIVVTDSHMKNVMMGVSYQQNSGNSESESPCPSPETVQEESAAEPTVTLVQKNKYLGAGCAKKTVPFKKMSLQRRKKLLAMSTRERERILKRPKRKVNTDSKLDNKNETLPPTPPTSVSAPPTPPASNSTSLTSDLSNDFSECSNNQKVINNSKKGHTLELNSELITPCDTSGDETSSKSTLDTIIPPPKDFEGKNNPFLAFLRGTTDEGKKKKEITLPLPLTAVIPGKPILRPMKRQLSEKDIIIGPNGQIKRKRFRRTRNPNAVYTSNGQTASKTAAVVPARPDTKEWPHRSSTSSNNGSNIGCMDYTLNGRRLRQRPEKPQEKDKASNPPTPKPSPVKQEPDINLDDLKSSVNIYFGAANRIAAGERFAIKAKRVGPNGKMDYLIEWEGPSNGMT
ncbi:PHD finger protein 19 [Diorhabda carinulata]|uniref:PHD finger protein 19 n=1 Tax=Diorhabda carinulata TaxID=1163345 RepID=UPI0025A2178E|nr:PHD finger protein 19 [Diorhabda carinulata]XP_057665253.1 PHD finger protein 19 [Diorhabda carinulata]